MRGQYFFFNINYYFCIIIIASLVFVCDVFNDMTVIGEREPIFLYSGTSLQGTPEKRS